MGFQKYLGYALAGIGAIGILISPDKIRANIPVISTIPYKIVLITSLGIVAAGVLLMIIFDKSSNKFNGKQKQTEVPIYKGKEIVGYRRA
jgi:hypothetical protein